MNASDKLQLIKALEEQDGTRKRRSSVIAWGSVGMAAVTLVLLIWAGGRELRQVQKQVEEKKQELAAAVKNLEDVKVKTDTALQAIGRQGATPSARDLENVVDAVIDANRTARIATGELPQQNLDRGKLIQQLFDQNPSVRVKAYGELLPANKDGATLVPEILKAIEQNPQNANGVYNSLVVLSHMNADALKKDSAEIRKVAESSKRIGPRVSERAGKLITRIPQQ
jgi:hypothetical protein